MTFVYNNITAATRIKPIQTESIICELDKSKLKISLRAQLQILTLPTVRFVYTVPLPF